MKNWLFTFCSLFVFTTGALASQNIADDFHAHYNAGSNLSAYNKDINTLIGINDFHTGKATSFPGFDIGGSFAAVKVGNDNNISSEDYLTTGFLTAETYIPVVGITAALRGTTINGLESIGAGIKYSYDILEVADITVAGFYDRAKTDWYTTDHYSVSAVASASVVFLTPYVGIGYDYGDFSTRKMTVNRDTSDGAVRYTAGLRVSPFPFVYVFGAYTKTAGNQGFQGGLGFNF